MFRSGRIHQKGIQSALGEHKCHGGDVGKSHATHLARITCVDANQSACRSYHNNLHHYISHEQHTKGAH